jgi:hypothetical protein
MASMDNAVKDIIKEMMITNSAGEGSALPFNRVM